MNDDTKKVNTQNAGEEDALIALRKHASDSLESDLLASAMASGLDQVLFFMVFLFGVAASLLSEGCLCCRT